MKKSYLIAFVIIIFVIVLLILVIPLISPYKTFSNEIIIEYPTNWYMDNYASFKQGHLFPFELYPDSNPEKQREMKASVTDWTYILNEKGIFNTSSAVEDWIEKDIISGLQNPQLTTKNLEENISIITFTYTSQNVTNYAYLKYLKCNNKIFELDINADIIRNSEYSKEIEHMINSFKCS